MRWKKLPPGWDYLLTHRQVVEMTALVGPGRLQAATLGAHREWDPGFGWESRSTGSIVARPVDGVWHYRLDLWAIRESEFLAVIDTARESVRAAAIGYIQGTEVRVADTSQDLFRLWFGFYRREGPFEPDFSTRRLNREDRGRLDREFD